MKKREKFSFKLIEQDGVTCVSINDKKTHYNTANKKDPKGVITKKYKDAPKPKRFSITNKLIERYEKLGLEPEFLQRRKYIG